MFWNRFDSVVFWNCFDSVVFWYCFDSVVFWYCFDSVVFSLFFLLLYSNHIRNLIPILKALENKYQVV